MATTFWYHRTLSLCIAVAFLVGVALRMAGAGGELWLDEMWSVVLLQGAHSLTDIVLSIHHDNNHLLTSVWLWISGSGASPLILRLPSVVCGTLTLVLLAVGSRWTKDASVYAVWFGLCCVSYPLVLYSSEARGYACMGLGAVLAWGALWMAIERGEAYAKACVFAAASSLALLAHATALFFLVPVSVWCLTGCMLKRARFPRIGWIALALVPPYGLALLLWVLHYRLIDLGGGPILPYWQVLLSTVSTACGGDELSGQVVGSTIQAMFLGGGVLSVVVVELLLWMREGDRWAWFLCAIFIFTLVAVGIFHPEYLAPRYLLVTLMPMYYLLARFLVRLLRQKIVGKVLAIGLLGAFLISSMHRVSELLTLHRSHFVEIFSDIQREQPGARVGGDHDYRNSIRLQYVRLLRPEVSSLVYLAQYRESGETTGIMPDVIIREGSDRHEVLPESLSLISGVTYRQVREYKAPLLSGSRTGVYWRR